MLPANFRNQNSFYIYHFTGQKVYPSTRGKKLHYVFDKAISFSEWSEPEVIFQGKKNLGKSSDDLDKHYINIDYLEDDDQKYIVKLMFQPGLDLG